MKDDLVLDKSTDATDAFMEEHELGASLLVSRRTTAACTLMSEVKSSFPRHMNYMDFH